MDPQENLLKKVFPVLLGSSVSGNQPPDALFMVRIDLSEFELLHGFDHITIILDNREEKKVPGNAQLAGTNLKSIRRPRRLSRSVSGYSRIKSA